MLLVHLLLAYNVADPLRLLMFQIYKKPSLALPSEARYCEFGLKETHLTPKVWSESAVSGM